MIEEQQNNPLHGLKLETMITELVDFYGWKILYAALKLGCFNTNPTIEACIIFLKKTEWAREKVENFYLYRFKRMPKAVGEQFDLKPRERGFASGIAPRKPMELTIESIAKMQAQASAEYEAGNKRPNSGYGSGKSFGSGSGKSSGKKPTGGRGTGSGYGSSNSNLQRRNEPRNDERSGPSPSTDDNDPWGTKRG
ncbi:MULTISPECIES: VF530 family DNA-binding protein [unclassified Shewanella]|uniref:VF530 family protein n=1 Tax=Shewanella TaxID=22 RepID=UPI0021D9BE72|nr:MULTISPECIES: VF530 family DNA-binding protein [unclassified Shewanella]MCU8023545.1 VF530 family DNA-binding protein [Shewanella sp. SM78]MCU8041701.1 VF530 family DNA-binding protein [Shewanella sp. SM68]MCU8046565.1 VF530 family DNA-binding protein [Shewanella sp. SM65]MCU8080582.1 VF530 family DNA-binding protein [Shewanella sp. SM103]